MRHLIICAAIIALTCAAPALNIEDGKSVGILLQRPSPINPAIIGDPKPVEKITKISDPKEVAQLEQKTFTTPAQTILVTTDAPKHRQKRDESVKHERTAPVRPQTLPAHLPAVAESSHLQHAATFVKPQTLPALLPADDPAHHANIQQTHADNKRETAAPKADTHTQQSAQTQEAAYQKPQTLPFIFSTEHAKVATAHTDAKRDIPVPLVAKHPHPEESSNENENKSDKPENEQKHSVEVQKPAVPNVHDVQVKDLSSVPAQQSHQPHHAPHHLQQQQHHEHANQQPHELHTQHTTDVHKQPVEPAISSTTSSTVHPVIRPHPVPVAELFARPKQQQQHEN